MTGPINVDTGAFRALDAAFDTANAEQQSAYQAVSAAQDALRTQWSGAAANEYHKALDGWMEGFTLVRQGMDDLRVGMTHFAGSTDTAEDDAIAAANSVQIPSW